MPIESSREYSARLFPVDIRVDIHPVPPAAFIFLMERPRGELGIVVRLGGRLFTLESRSSKGGVTMAPLSNRLAHCCWFPVNVPWGDDKLDRALAKVDIVPYGTRDAPRAAFRLPSIRSGEQCAEFVGNVHGEKFLSPGDAVDWAVRNAREISQDAIIRKKT